MKRYLVYFAERTQIPQFFQVHRGMKDYEMPEYRFRQSQEFERKIYANAHFLTIWKWGKNEGKEIPYIIDGIKTIDIDNPIDFEFAEFVMKKENL